MLDASSAFDCVWYDGLFHKIYNCGINGKLWRVLQSAYSNVKSCVLFDGVISPWFDVCQSVRQGRVLSPWLYVIYLNDLPRQLEQLNIGAFIHDEFNGCPMLADDVALLALAKHDLDSMMHVCYEYSRKFRYTIGVSTLDLVPIQITLIRIKLVRIGYTLRPHMNRITLVCMPSH